MGLATLRSLSVRLEVRKIHPWLTASVLLVTSFKDVTAADVRVVRYSKEEIQQKSERNFIKPSSLGGVIIAKIREIAVTATSRQTGNNTALRDLATSTKELSKREWTRKMAALSYDPDQSRNQINESLMRQTLLTQSQKAAEVTLKREFPILERFRTGMTFNLNFGNKNQGSSQKIRYGLIERDIIPNSQPIPLAAFGSMNDLDRSYATPAHVIYTIDRLDQPEVRSVFPDSDLSDEQRGDRKFNWDRLPRAKVVVKIDGGGQDGSVSEQVASGSPIGLRLKLIQSDGLISSQVIIGNRSIEKTLLTEISLPLPGGLKLSQKLDHRFRLAEVVARGVFEDRLSSQINVGYSKASQNIRGEWLFARNKMNYGLSAESAAGSSNSDVNSTPNHRFAFALNKNF
jgi:hypothetical protein